MGCGLRKMKPASDENSPGKIYSTLKRPQVETKVGVAYTYQYLDFLIGKDGGTSTLRLSSVRELPDQLQELYQQGFVLAAVHPFIHPCGPQSNSPQHQLYRAVLVRINDGVERSQPVCPPNKLLLEECLSAEQVPTPELIQGYVKKQMQDFADHGVMFVGFVQEPYGAPCTRIREPETPSLSLHSSPSSILGSLDSCSPSNPSSPKHLTVPGIKSDSMEKSSGIKSENNSGSGVGSSGRDAISPAASPLSEADLENSEVLTEEDSSYHNNNKDIISDRKEKPRYRRGDGAELLALYNNPPSRESQVKYYTVKVPLRVQSYDEGIKVVEANWLDHLTQHFNNGASLVDGYFYLGNGNDLLPKAVESVFVFQEANESEPNTAAPTYDAIVVEQWTIIDGLQVKTDYVPLLQSLATYGWRLTCVLPTPVIRTNSDGSLSTKQIVFLQRPVIGRKKRESKKLIFKTRSKSNKNCIKDVAKNKKKNTIIEKDSEDSKIADDEKKAGEKEEKTESTNAAQVEAGGEYKKERKTRCEEDKMADAGMGISMEKVTRKDGPEKSENKAAENCDEDSEKKAPDGEGSEKSGEALGKKDVEEVTETVETVEPQSDSKEKEPEGTSKVVSVIENGIETDEEKDDSEKNKIKTEEPVEVITKDTVADPTATNLSPVEAQE